MRKLCPNLDYDDALETVLEVPIPEEIFTSANKNKSWQSMKSWMKPISGKLHPSMSTLFGGQKAEIQLLLGVVGAPLIPLPILDHHSINQNIKDHPIEASMAKYIVQQYIAAVGGEHALNSIQSMYAMGKVKMATSEFSAGEGSLNSNKVLKVKKTKHKAGELGGFVLWQKQPDLWCLELVVSGYKISAGSDGKVAWRQTPWHQSHASRGPPRPLRRFLQGLDPKSTADLFTSSVCMGEKTVNNEDCFILKLEADPSALRARSSNNVDIIKHTVWGYFSQRTGLLVQLEDSHLLKIKSTSDDIFWETTMKSLIQDYRTIDGINIAHAGRTSVSLFRFGENSDNHSRTKMEEVWSIEEIDFNVQGLSMECFLPPADMKKEEEGCGDIMSNPNLPPKIRAASFRINSSKIIAVDAIDSYSTGSEDSSDEDF